MRATLGADRSREHLEAHARGETVTNHHLRAEQVVDWATRGGSRALRPRRVVGSLEPGKKADVVLIKNDDSPVMFPLLHPYGHVAFQAQRGDVHTVLVNGRVSSTTHRLVGVDLAAARRAVEETVEYAASRAGRGRLDGGHAPRDPARPRSSTIRTPYTEWDAARHSGSARGGGDEHDGRRGRSGWRGCRDAARGAPRGARAPPGHRGGVARGARVPDRVGRADEFVLLSDVTRTSVLIDAMSHGDDDGGHRERRRGPAVPDDPPWREAPVQDLRGLRGHGRRRGAVRARRA